MPSKRNPAKSNFAGLLLFFNQALIDHIQFVRGRFFWIRYWEGLATWPRRFCNLVGDLCNPQQEDVVVYARPLHGAWEFIPYPSDLGWLFVHCNIYKD